MNGELQLNKFKNAMNLMREVSDECVFNISKNGINIKMVDPANVCMLWLTIPNTAFDNYNCKDDIVFGADLDKISIWLAKAHRFGSTAKLHIDTDFKLSCGSYTFGVTHIDVETIRKQPRIPNLDEKQLENKFIISSNNIKNAFDVITNDYAFLISNDDSIKIYSEYANEKTFTEIVFGDEITIERRSETRTRSLFSLDYLNDILPKIKPVSKNVSVEFGNDFPIKICSVDNDIKFGYLQAPRIESD